MTEEDTLLTKAFPVLRLLLKYFEGNPVNSDRDMRMTDIEEDLETSPGELLEHFSWLYLTSHLSRHCPSLLLRYQLC